VRSAPGPACGPAPAPVAEWLSALARILGVQQPTQALRLAAGEAGAALMTEICGAALEIADGQITSIHAIVNPDKLAHLGPVGDFGSLRGRAG
jgi:RNA polymerase sigma-70 factor (ECF subfamily)